MGCSGEGRSAPKMRAKATKAVAAQNMLRRAERLDDDQAFVERIAGGRVCGPQRDTVHAHGYGRTPTFDRLRDTDSPNRGTGGGATRPRWFLRSGQQPCDLFTPIQEPGV